MMQVTPQTASPLLLATSFHEEISSTIDLKYSKCTGPEEADETSGSAKDVFAAEVKIYSNLPSCNSASPSRVGSLAGRSCDRLRAIQRVACGTLPIRNVAKPPTTSPRVGVARPAKIHAANAESQR